MFAVYDLGPGGRLPDPFNLAAYVIGMAAVWPDKTALRVVGGDGDVAQSWTYAALARMVRGTASGLIALGLGPGDRVLIRLGNTPDVPIVFLGAIAAGLIPVLTSPDWGQDDVTGAAQLIAPRLVVQDPALAAPDGDWPVLEPGALAAMRDLPPHPWALGPPDRPAYIVFTAGTSGRPRAVVHAHRAIWARRMMWDGWYGLQPRDRLMHAGAFDALYTLGTGLLDPWAAGATAVIPGPGVTPEHLPALMATERITIFAAAPGQYRRLLQAEMPRLPRLRHGVSAGEKLSDSLRAGWEQATGRMIHEAFGMTECAGFLSGSPRHPAPPGCLGYPQRGRRLAILQDGMPVARGEAGQIAVHQSDPGLMLGYLDDPQATAAGYLGEWFLTGDIGRMAHDDAISYDGRADAAGYAD